MRYIKQKRPKIVSFEKELYKCKTFQMNNLYYITN